MGIFDKLFGGDKRAEDTNAGSQPTATPAPSPAPEGPVPARRERSKPTGVPAAGNPDAAAASGDAASAVPLSMDGENSAVLHAIQQIVASDNSETRTALYTAILASQLYLVSLAPADGPDDIGTGEVTLQEGQQLSLATIRDAEGRVFLPAFTDVERLSQSLPEKARYIRIPAPAVCRMFLQGGGDGILINPAQPPSGVITRAEAEILANNVVPAFDENGQLRGDVAQQMRIAIGKPEATPAESFVAAIRTEAANHPIVREVHLFMAAIADQPPRLMIGILTNEGLVPEEMHPAFEAIGKAAYEGRGDTEAFDMMPLNDQMIEAIRPIEGVIYSRDQEV